MRRTRVALVGCGSYERGLVESRMEEAFDLIGGPQAIAGGGESVFIKVNGLLPAAPERAVTTHPEVVRAVVRQFQKVTDEVVIGDSPGGLYNNTMLKRLYDRCGYRLVADETGARLNFDTSVRDVRVHEGKTVKSATVCGAMADCHHLVSVSKFKTHLQMNITGAIKNVFGAVPGMTKFSYHARFNSNEEFADLLLDVLLAANPSLHVVDAVDGMDGDGPRQGDVRRMGIIAIGENALAVDTAMMAAIGLPPEVNKPLGRAIARGLFGGSLEEVDLLGDPLETLAVTGFKLPSKKDTTSRVPTFVMDRFGRWLSIRPLPKAGSCTACGKCEQVCPAGAVSIVGGTAIVDGKKCIRCYCCHELCEHDAIELERPALMRVFQRLGG
jgi:uncharacterized protein (DUF362 family)/NAD-dependent dihydropyrimidine dehydrogenase PreA subunit